MNELCIPLQCQMRQEVKFYTKGIPVNNEWKRERKNVGWRWWRSRENLNKYLNRKFMLIF